MIRTPMSELQTKIRSRCSQSIDATNRASLLKEVESTHWEETKAVKIEKAPIKVSKREQKEFEIMILRKMKVV